VPEVGLEPGSSFPPKTSPIPCVSGCFVTGSLLLDPVLRAGGRSIMDFVMPVRVSNRKHFTTNQKHAILDEYDKCLEWGSKAAFIRAVGITEGTMNHWCRQRVSGELRSRSDKLKEDQRLNAGDKQLLKRVLKENEILKAKLARSEAAVDILGKASALLDAMAKSAAATDPKVEEPEPGRPEWLTPKPGKTSP
jgi:transposase